ncbi:nicotinamide riboside transporter PnuC [Cardinium endosymbiont of Nabis limbatus]|uniref:nicotinamide riboside transporter PnuC n=1 Tax=Cardinium endosymbiont of Nabis limbatus TaxID=3066217 RepID=UPI003AF3D531
MNFFYLEAFAFITGLLSVYLLIKVSLWNWFFGIITVLSFLFIFFNAKLYAEMGLQVVFLALQCYGIYQWSSSSPRKNSLSIQLAHRSVYYAYTANGLLLFTGISYMLNKYTDSTTVYADVWITTLSLIAQWMMGKKYLQHWLLWIVVDISAIILYIYKALYLTALLYFIYIFLAIIGYKNWKNLLKEAIASQAR